MDERSTVLVMKRIVLATFGAVLVAAVVYLAVAFILGRSDKAPNHAIDDLRLKGGVWTPSGSSEEK